MKMCGNGRSNDTKIGIYLGWYGAELTVDDLTYCIEGDYKKDTTKEEMKNYIIHRYKYDDFLEKLLECIDNGSDE